MIIKDPIIILMGVECRHSPKTPHKWGKEIIAWANGSKIKERKIGSRDWFEVKSPRWNDKNYEFKIVEYE